MKFKLDFRPPEIFPKIGYHSSLFFIGSCFSNDIGSAFQEAGFETEINPYGTIFHPIPIAKNLMQIVQKSRDFPVSTIQEKIIYWNSSLSYPYHDVQDVKNHLLALQTKLEICLKNTSHLFITFGSSFAYKEKENNSVVANCHKVPATHFSRELSTVEEMSEIWKETLTLLQNAFPKIKVIFTVSPVRHSKEGLIENNRSKARLFELISILENDFSVSYFPSYEVIIDELRDYRFYKEDMVHPNEIALKYIWEILKNTSIESNSLQILLEFEQIQKLRQHKIISTNSEEILKFEREKNKKITTFKENYPMVKFY